MPLLIKHIDQIAREKNRSVVFVSFEGAENISLNMPAPNHFYARFEDDPNRKELIKWLNENSITWEPCAHFASEGGWSSYSGNIYIDVPWDETDEQFLKVQKCLENADGTMKNPLVKFWGITLDQAMQNAHHDEPGFWEKWAGNF